MWKAKRDIVGLTVGRLTVAGKSTTKDSWLCRCECGVEKSLPGKSLRQGRPLSCGCLKAEANRARNSALFTKHGMAGTATYFCWPSMKCRCLDPGHHAWSHYGGRGISVCDRWMDFGNFIADMGAKPHGLTLDRINNDGNYEPGNCRWATQREQASNRRGLRMISFRGEVLPANVLARQYGISPGAFRHRIDRLGWSVDDALSTPPDPSKQNRRQGKHR